MLVSLACCAQGQAALIGAPAPDFSLADNTGSSVTLSDFSGTGVILDFCAVWCAACIGFYNIVYPNLDPAVQSLVLPVVLQDNNFNPSTQAIAEAWVSTFFTDRALHMSGSSAVEANITDAYFPSVQNLTLPTFFFIDASLNVIGISEGVDTSAFDRFAADILASQTRANVPVPASLPLALLGLGLMFARRASSRHEPHN